MQPAQLVAPKEAPLEALLDVHTEDYLHRIHTSSWTIAQARHRGDALSVTGLLTSGPLVQPLYQLGPYS